uniref:Uncharacterized protein n=1 Tax=Pyxicephalus adspersus TaxID=30357 RepID=A0AAV3B819_PYXAD|nr:TPA: hypothetical protein GDO54_001826 [Pyxicephalus adspersus]
MNLKRSFTMSADIRLNEIQVFLTMLSLTTNRNYLASSQEPDHILQHVRESLRLSCIKKQEKKRNKSLEEKKIYTPYITASNISFRIPEEGPLTTPLPKRCLSRKILKLQSR